MSIRRFIAFTTLAAGLGGAGIVAADTSLVVGSTSDAGVMTVCASAANCTPGGGPIKAGPIFINPVQLTTVTTAQ